MEHPYELGRGSHVMIRSLRLLGPRSAIAISVMACVRDAVIRPGAAGLGEQEVHTGQGAHSEPWQQ